MAWTTKSVSVGITSTAVVSADQTRRGLTIVNDSDTTIYLARGIAAELNKGIRLNANGGTYEADPERDGLPIDAYFAITSSAGKNLSVQEYLR